MLTLINNIEGIKAFTTEIINDFILKIVDDLYQTSLDKVTFTKGVMLALHEAEFLSLENACW